MKILYQCFTLVLALGCWQTSLANGDDDNAPPPNPKVTNISLSGLESSNSVCLNDPFTGSLTVSNERSGDIYRWKVGIGTVNGILDFVETGKTATLGVTRAPSSGGLASISVNVIRNGMMIQGSGNNVDVTVLPEVTPAQPSFISITPDNPNSPTNTVICQNSGATFSVPAVNGAYQYRWTVDGRTTTTRSRTFSAFFNNTGTQTVSVRAVGCAGTSATRSVDVIVIPGNQSPCNSGVFFSMPEGVTASPNPSTTAFVLEVPDSYVSATAQLTDQKTGQVVKTFVVTGTETEVDTQRLPSGVYLLTVPGPEGKVTKRIVVQ